MAKRPRRRYSDDFRANAIVMLESQGYPDHKGALVTVAQHLGIPFQTLSRWARELNNPAPPELVLEKRLELKELIRNEIYAALEAAPNAREFAEYKELITGAAILLDKLQLLEGKPTAISEENVNIIDARETVLSRLGGLAAFPRQRTVRGQPDAARTDDA